MTRRELDKAAAQMRRQNAANIRKRRAAFVSWKRRKALEAAQYRVLKTHYDRLDEVLRSDNAD